MPNEIRNLTGYLVEHGLADDQNYPLVTSGPQHGVDISYPSSGICPVHLKDRAYVDTYALLVDARAYNVRMLDGAMLQLSYAFTNGALLKHRLAFLPHPDLPLFQNTPEEYLEDALYADVLDHRSYASLFASTSIARAASRKTLPILSAISHWASMPDAESRQRQHSPLLICRANLRAFYNTASRSITTALPGRVLRPGELHTNTITRAEGALAHIGVPG